MQPLVRVVAIVLRVEVTMSSQIYTIIFKDQIGLESNPISIIFELNLFRALSDRTISNCETAGIK